jgi:hypothetical protein
MVTDIDGLILNPNLTWKYFQDNIEDHCNEDQWHVMSYHPCVSWNMIQNNDDLYHGGLFRNPNITIDIIERNSDIEWDYKELSKNKLTLQNELLENRCLKKYILANKMKSRRINKLYIPDELLCQQRLVNDFMGMIT